MKLGVFERMKLASVLPRKGDYRTLMAIRSLRGDLAFSIDEQKRLKFRGVFKCSSCKKTNVESAQQIVDGWQRGGKVRRMFPTEQDLGQELTKLFVRQDCYHCKAPMQATGEVVWQRVKEKDKVVPLEKEVKISNKLTKLIAKALSDLEKRKELSDALVPLYEKFVGVSE